MTAEQPVFIHSALLGKYTITKQLGHGTQGVMYQAKASDGTICAIKAYNLKTIPNWKAGDMMLREIETMQTLHVEHVPECIEIIDASSDPEPHIFIVQQFINGRSLLDLMQGGRRFTMTDIIQIMKDVAKTLDEINQLYRIVHRDIKPSNIMLDEDGHAWLVDFGSVVKCVKSDGGSTIAGTAGYMAPEQCLGEATPVSDIYGLGMTIIQLITRCEPFEFEQEHLKPLYHEKLPSNVPAWLVELLDQMIEPFTIKRATISQVLRAVLSGNPNAPAFVLPQKAPQETALVAKPKKPKREMSETEKRFNRENHLEDFVDAPFIMCIPPDLVFIVTSFLIIVGLAYLFLGADDILSTLIIYPFVIIYAVISIVTNGAEPDENGSSSFFSHRGLFR